MMLITACDNHSEIQPSGNDATQKSVILEIESDRSSGTIDTTFNLKANYLEYNASVDTFRWSINDGRTFEGSEISLDFTESGVFTIRLDAFEDTQLLASAEAAITIFSNNATGTPDLYNLPTKLSDPNGDGNVSLSDVLAASQILNSTEEAKDEKAYRSADLNFDGAITNADIELLANAVLHKEALPTALLDISGYPGSTVTIVSDLLRDPAADISISVDGTVVDTPMRPILGYTTFSIPRTISVGPRSVQIDLSINGDTKASFDYQLNEPPTMAADARTDLETFFNEVDAVYSAQIAALSEQVTNNGLSEEDRKALISGSEAAKALYASLKTGLIDILNKQPDDRFAMFLQEQLYIYGVDEFRKQYASLPSTTPRAASAKVSPDLVCDIVDAICISKKAVSAVNTAGNIVQGACAAGAVVGVVTSFLDGPLPAADAAAVTAWTSICLPLVAPIQIVGYLNDALSLVHPNLALEASKTTLNADETSTITASINLGHTSEICGLIAGNSSDSLGLINKLSNALGNRLVGFLIRKNTTFSGLSRIYAVLGEGAYVSFLKTIQGVVNTTLTSLGISDALTKLATKYCPTSSGFGALVINSEDVLSNLAINEGTLLHNADGTASYSCPPADPAFNQKHVITATKTLCDGEEQKSVQISCSTAEVTITMGDNGSLNDDIFEVIIDGKTVLTSSVPVRSTSTTVQLPTGRTEVIMRGHAAPDGIGTYFINFSGASVISGQTSGSDLTPGVTKTIVIEVI